MLKLRRNHKTGKTLIELLVVVLIIGLLVMTQMKGWVDQAWAQRQANGAGFSNVQSSYNAPVKPATPPNTAVNLTVANTPAPTASTWKIHAKIATYKARAAAARILHTAAQQVQPKYPQPQDPRTIAYGNSYYAGSAQSGNFSGNYTASASSRLPGQERYCYGSVCL